MARWAIVWTENGEEVFCTLCRADTAEDAVLAAEVFYDDPPGTYRAVRIPDDQPAVAPNEIDDYLGSESCRLDGTPGYEWPGDDMTGVIIADTPGARTLLAADRVMRDAVTGGGGAEEGRSP